MRSIVLALAFIAPAAAAFAAPADYTSPLVSVHATKATKPQQVMLTFQNNAVQDRILQVGDSKFTIRVGHSLSAAAPVGSIVRVYSNQDSKLNGKPILQVTPADGSRIITMN